MFKPTTNKKVKYNNKNGVTLDNKHNEFLNEFSKDENIKIPSLKKEKGDLQKKLKNVHLNIEQKLEIIDKIKFITDEIRNTKNNKKNYFLDNSKYIFEYFENKKNISNNNNNQVNKVKLLNSFFKINEDESNNIINQNQNNNIVQKYLSNIDTTFLDINSYIYPTDICKYCYKGELVPLDDEGILICNICYKNVPYLIENEKPSYKEPPKEVCFYA